MNKDNLTDEQLNKPVTMGGLLEYTDDFLIPKIADIVEDKVESVVDDKIKKVESVVDDKIKKAHAKLEYNLKSYIDDKLADYTSDIFKRLDKKYTKDKEFKAKVVEIFKKNKIGSSEELAFLEGLVEGSY